LMSNGRTVGSNMKAELPIIAQLARLDTTTSVKAST